MLARFAYVYFVALGKIYGRAAKVIVKGIGVVMTEKENYI